MRNLPGFVDANVCQLIIVGALTWPDGTCQQVTPANALVSRAARLLVDPTSKWDKAKYLRSAGKIRMTALKERHEL